MQEFLFYKNLISHIYSLFQGGGQTLAERWFPSGSSAHHFLQSWVGTMMTMFLDRFRQTEHRPPRSLQKKKLSSNWTIIFSDDTLRSSLHLPRLPTNVRQKVRQHHNAPLQTCSLLQNTSVRQLLSYFFVQQELVD